MKKKMFFPVCVSLFLSCLALPVPGQITWQKEPSNPVLVPDQAWESSAIWGPCVIRLENVYVMGYCSSDSIGMATSTDGIHWTKYHDNPVFEPGAPGAWDDRAVSDPAVVYDGNLFYMWYHGKGDRIEIGLATSADGLTWERSPANPVLQRGPAGGWDGTYVTHPNVIYEPGDSLPFKMWFTGRQSGYWRWRLGAAGSMNGTVWVKWEDNPVMNVRGDCWDDYFCARSSTIRRPGLPFEMLYSGATATYLDRVGYAVSADGIHWKRFEEPVLFPTRAWEGNSVDDPCFLFEDGLYKAWFVGGVRSGIGYAESACGE
jgi:predicted GH43/DUF377 family glycosyl hydrolase